MRMTTMIRHAREGSTGSAALAGMTIKMNYGTMADCPFDPDSEPELVAAFKRGFDQAVPTWLPKTPPKAPAVSKLALPQINRDTPKPEYDYNLRYIYLMACEGSDLRKIGISRDPTKRLRGLAAGSAAAVSCVALYAVSTGNARSLEFALHQACREQWSHGEWFAISDDEFHTLTATHAARLGMTVAPAPLPPTPKREWPHYHGGPDGRKPWRVGKKKAA